MSTASDSHLAKLESNAAKEAQHLEDLRETQQLPEVEETATGTFLVSVRNETPALGMAYCVTLSSTNEYLQLVPRDPSRRNAVVLPVDNDVYICSSREVAAQVAGSTTSTLGSYFPKGIAVPIDSRSPYWVACTTTASTSRVSVLVSKDSE
jgi:hypothetical protein